MHQTIVCRNPRVWRTSLSRPSCEVSQIFNYYFHRIVDRMLFHTTQCGHTFCTCSPPSNPPRRCTMSFPPVAVGKRKSFAFSHAITLAICARLLQTGPTDMERQQHPRRAVFKVQSRAHLLFQIIWTTCWAANPAAARQKAHSGTAVPASFGCELSRIVQTTVRLTGKSVSAQTQTKPTADC